MVTTGVLIPTYSLPGPESTKFMTEVIGDVVVAVKVPYEVSEKVMKEGSNTVFSDTGVTVTGLTGGLAK
jgi:hypothetical protein